MSSPKRWWAKNGDMMLENIFRLDGKVVVITGASSGLGYRIAKEFIRENARLSICARRLYKLKKIYKSKAKVFFQKVDISDERAIKKFIKKTVKIFCGRIFIEIGISIISSLMMMLELLLSYFAL